MIRHGIELESNTLRKFCRRWRVRELAVFGSYLRDDFGPGSDVDFLVAFDQGVRRRFREILQMEDELAAIVGRRVDLIEREQLEDPEANPIRKRHILSTLAPLNVR